MRVRKIAIAIAAPLLLSLGIALPAATAHASTITLQPPQPAITVYSSGNSANFAPYEHPGALIVSSEANAATTDAQNASAAGATVLDYLDVPLLNDGNGPYSIMLDDASVCGPAVPDWPGDPTANSFGKLADFRTAADGGGILQSKLHCVLEKMVSDNPWIGGFLADDLGSRSWYPGFDWTTFGATNQQDYRDGAIAALQTFHDVAVERGLITLVNGTWEAGALASAGGGYPDMNANGASLASGGEIEHHASDELPFWEAYASGQWATASGDPAAGNAVMYVQAADSATLNTYMATNDFAFGSAQTDYAQPSTPWTSFHPTGLPTHSTTGNPVPVLSNGHVVTTSKTGGTVAWSQTVTSTDNVLINGPGPLNGKTGKTTNDQAVYSGAECGHNYTVTVTPTVNGTPEGNPGKITFATKAC